MFAGYLILFSWLVTKVKFFTNAGLTKPQLVIVFLLKVMAGIIYGWIGVYYGEMAKMVDTWAYHYQSLSEYNLLKSDPIRFFTSVFHNPYPDGYTRFLSEQSWWNDLKGNLFIKFLALLDLFTFGHYYINVVVFSFLSLFGPVAIYRVMQDVFPAKKLAVLLATFLIPSFIYWMSGLHKDGLIFLGIALLCYHIYFGFREKKFSFGRIAIIFFSLTLVIGLRNFFLVPLVPALVAWVLAEKTRYRPIYVFSAVYLLFIVLFFSAKYIHPRLDLPAAVAEKQQAFLSLGGSSSVHMRELEPTFTGFLSNFPQAISLSALRPSPTDVKHLLSLAASLEINFLLLLFLVFLFWKKNGTTTRGFLLFCIFFGFSLLLMIGYTVPNIGAVVRYRSIVLPFLIVPVVAQIDWRRIGKTFFQDIEKK